MDLTKDGVTDIAYYNNNYNPSMTPIGTALVGIPGLYESVYQGTMAYHKVSQQSPILDIDFLKNGVRPIGTLLLPSYEFWTTGKEIKVPEDLKGAKVRGPGGILNNTLEYLGAVPINISVTEMYEAFDRGVVDVVNMYGGGIQDYGLDELVTFGTQNYNFGGVGVGLIINENRWQGLPENVKKAINQAGDEFTESMANYYQQREEDIYAEFKNSDKVNIHELSENERKQWQKVYNDFQEEWIKKQDSEDFTKAIEMFKEELKK